jgi:hypothetical protein
MVDIQRSSKAPVYRRRAAMCDDGASFAGSDVDRRRLLRLRDAWLTLAADQDWRDDRPPSPAAKASAMAVPG